MLVIRNRTYPAQAGAGTNKYIAFLMSGTPPANATELAAKVDMSDLSAIHALSVGNCVAGESTSFTKINPTTIYGGKLSYVQNDSYTWFKNGAMPLRADNTKYQYLPARIFRVDGRKLSGNRITPSTFMSPMPRTNAYAPALNMRDSAADPLTTTFQLEFDRPVPVTGFYYYGLPTTSYAYPSNIQLQYQDGNGVWQNAAALSANFTVSTAVNIGSTVTAQNFRFVISAANSTILNIDVAGLALFGAADLPPIAVPNITWIILIPLYLISASIGSGSWLYASVWEKHTTRFKYLPAIVDNAGDATAGQPCILSAATNLTTQSHPTLMTYAHAMGVLK